MGVFKTLKNKLGYLIGNRRKKEKTLRENNLGHLYSPSEFADVQDINWKKKQLEREKRKRKSRKRRESRRRKEEMMQAMFSSKNYGFANNPSFHLPAAPTRTTNAAAAATAATAAPVKVSPTRKSPPKKSPHLTPKKTPVHVPADIKRMSQESVNYPTETVKKFNEFVLQLGAMVTNDKEARSSKYKQQLAQARILFIEAESDQNKNPTTIKYTEDYLSDIEKNLTEKELMYNQKWEELLTESKLLEERYQKNCVNRIDDTTVKMYFHALKNQYHRSEDEYKVILEKIRPIVNACSTQKEKFEHDQLRIAQVLQKLETLGDLNAECKKPVHTDKLKSTILVLKGAMSNKNIDSAEVTKMVEAANKNYETVQAECIKLHDDLVKYVSPAWTYAKYAAYTAAALGTVALLTLGPTKSANYVGDLASGTYGALGNVASGAYGMAGNTYQGAKNIGANWVEGGLAQAVMGKDTSVPDVAAKAAAGVADTTAKVGESVADMALFLFGGTSTASYECCTHYRRSCQSYK